MVRQQRQAAEGVQRRRQADEGPGHRSGEPTDDSLLERTCATSTTVSRHAAMLPGLTTRRSWSAPSLLVSRCGCLSSVIRSPHFLQTTSAYIPDLGRFEE